tara:strand:- start:939 stop:1757 length:819 start_codon:yes stop_codon:yes gene_type:complete
MVDQVLADKFAKKLGFSEYASVSKTGIAMTCDGVGTKLLVAEHFNKFDTIGIDLVAMSANDLLCSGSYPSRFMDYYATGDLNLEKSLEIIKGIKEGCRLADCDLVGGETAQLKPMFRQNHWFDLAGFMVGLQRKVFDLDSIERGDVLVGLPSSGVHSNGFTTLRNSTDKWDIEWLNPTRIYTKEIMGNLDIIKACAHITGGGLHGNLPRILGDTPYYLDIKLDEWWTNLRESLKMSLLEFAEIFNCGWGMVLVMSERDSLKIKGSKVIGDIL